MQKHRGVGHDGGLGGGGRGLPLDCDGGDGWQRLTGLMSAEVNQLHQRMEGSKQDNEPRTCRKDHSSVKNFPHLEEPEDKVRVGSNDCQPIEQCTCPLNMRRTFLLFPISSVKFLLLN